MDPISIIVAFFSTVLTAIYYISSRKFDYWSKQKNIAHLKPVPILGNYGPYVLQQLSLAEMAQRCCQEHPDEPLVGAFCLTEPVLLVQDPEYIKLIMTKDFYYFSSREISEHSHKEVMTKNLFFTYGDNWRVLRQNLTPLFTSAKMRNMFYLLANCSKQLEIMLEKETSESNIVEMRSLMIRYTMDCICSAAFGIESKAMECAGNKNVFMQMGNAIFDGSTWRGVKAVGRRYWPGIFYALGLQVFSEKLNTFFTYVLSNVLKARNYEPSSRQDFVDLLLSLKKNKYMVGDCIRNLKDHGDEKAKIEIDDALLMAHCMVFFGAGFETSATSLGFVLYELAKHPQVQERVLKEVDAYFSNRSEVQFDCLTELPYLQQCIDEASRLYPVLGVIVREVYEEYTFPNGVHVDKGVRVQIPVYHMHRNPKYFPEPEKFKPERFSPEKIKNIVPYTFMPFGEGPRICIGMRFAKMQMMSGLVTLLKKYRVELADDMPTNVKLEPRSLVSFSDIGIRLKVIKRNCSERNNGSPVSPNGVNDIFEMRDWVV